MQSHGHARIALRVGTLEPDKGLIPVAAVRESFRDLEGGRVIERAVNRIVASRLSERRARVGFVLDAFRAESAYVSG